MIINRAEQVLLRVVRLLYRIHTKEYRMVLVLGTSAVRTTGRRGAERVAEKLKEHVISVICLDIAPPKIVYTSR